MALKIMLYTNIFKQLLAGKFDLSQVPGDTKIYVTHVQREKLLAIFTKIIQDLLPNESTVLEQSKLGGASAPKESIVWDVLNCSKAKWSDESTEFLYSRILSMSESRDPNPRKKKSHIFSKVVIP